MNQSLYTVNLGADPETIQLGSTEGRKLRCAEKARGKKAITRWFNAIVTGKDIETADRLAKGDTIQVTGELVLTEYAPKKPRYKGEKVKSDEMPFARIFQVIKSPTFFTEEAQGEEEAPASDAVATEAPDISAEDNPLAGLEG